jgi:hypothetical protein
MMRMPQSLVFCRPTICSLAALASLAGSSWGCGENSPSDSGINNPSDSGINHPSDSGISTPLDKDSFGKKFKLADSEVSGWKQDASDSAYSLWTADNLTDKIDGAAPAYTSRGCKFAMYQDLVGPDPEVCGVLAMDFGTDAKATSMFAYQKDLTGASVAIPQYDSGTAIGYPSLTGMTVFAHFGWAYFELQLDGYSDQAKAGQAATPFLKALEQKSK